MTQVPVPSTVQLQALPRRMLLAFMLTTVIAPATMLNKLLFVGLMLWTLRLLMRRRNPRPHLSWPTLGVIGIFTYGLLMCLPARNDNALAVQFFLATFVLMLIHFVDHFRIDMDQAVEFCGKAMIVVTILYWMLALNLDLPIATELFVWFNQISMSASAERDFIEGGATLTLALGAVPFLFVPWCLVCVRLFKQLRLADFLWLVLYGVAIGLSGARGIVVVALAFLVAASIWLTTFRTRILIILALVAILAIGLPVLVATTTIFSSEEVSNAAKIGHFNSFLDALDVSGALFGNGLGSYYFSSGKGMSTAHTELTPIDLARYLGIPLAIAFYGLLLLPVSSLSRYRGDQFLYGFGFMLFLVLSITNPTLVNSYGMLIVVWYWAKMGQSDPRSALPVQAAHASGSAAVNVAGVQG
jgi:hypothetical protein